MLTYLSVKNVSVIESVSFELDKGLTVLTGETGSGKSVLLGALKLLLGERFQRNMLREGADKISVEGIFTDVSKAVSEELKESFDIEDEVSIRREVDEAGKNRIFINGKVATVSQLRDLGGHLADIHGQHEHQSLLDESRHIDFIDYMVPADVKAKYEESYKKYRYARAERDKLIEDIDEVKKHQEIVEFQFNEIAAANINLKEDKELDEKIAFLSHIEKIKEACAISMDALAEGEINAEELISKSLKAIETTASIVPEMSTLSANLADVLDRLNEVTKTLSFLYDRQEGSPEELDSMLQRKYLLQDLVKKYGGNEEPSLEAVVEKGEELKQRINNFENSDEVLNKLERIVSKTFEEARKDAQELLNSRKKAADIISKEVVEILSELELPNCRFVVSFAPKESLDIKGGVDIKFFISVNVGFEPAPLAQVASGGEISRVMLAMKEVFSGIDFTDTLFFDEIDTGISGKTAKKVAQKLKSLSKKKQVIVITHLPVVAASGNSHFHISKSAEAGITKTIISPLSHEDRQNTIASMIAGAVTSSSIQQAQELLSENI